MKNSMVSSRNCTTKALSFTLILGLLLSSLVFSASFSGIFNTNVQALADGEWLGPNCTVDWYYFHEGDDAYSISTAEELGGLATLVNYGMESFEGKTIKLTANINLGEHYWIPIGRGEDENKNLTNVFKGTFDGQGYTIDNMLIGKDTYETSNYPYAGLFGYIENATIQNVNIGANSQVYASNTSGGICSYASNSTISNCSNGGMILSKSEEGTVYTGGICGQASNSTISKCKNSATIISNCNASDNSSYAGGVCGGTSDSTISCCVNSGMVTSNAVNKSSYAGGICGQTSNSNMSDCSNSESVFASNYVGGICALAENTTINNSYYKNGTAEKGIGSQEEQTGTRALSDKEIEDKTEEILSKESSTDPNAAQTYWTDDGNYDISWYDANATEFEVNNANQLAGLAVLVNNATDNFESKTVKLTADIDLVKYYWVPIGLGDNNNDDGSEATNIFKGTFDGQGYAIDGMLIGKSEDEAANYRYAGLFGDINGGTIENVNIGENSHIYNKSGMSGGICGTCESATINNCSNSGEIDKSEHSGGICGYALESIISACINNGSISAESFAGGICGSALRTKINCCSNGGKIFALNYAGGICGLIFDYTEISNCINVENIIAMKGAGGISGAADHYVTICDCNNSGNVSSHLGTAGGICGEAVNTTTISNCYYKQGVAAKGIGNQDDNDQEGTTVLSEEETDNKAKELLGQEILARKNDTNGDAKTSEENYTGWKQIEGDFYYFDNGTMLTDSWCIDNAESTYWYVDANGKTIENVYALENPKTGQYIYYIDNNLANGIHTIGTVTYEFSDGISVNEAQTAA